MLNRAFFSSLCDPLLSYAHHWLQTIRSLLLHNLVKRTLMEASPHQGAFGFDLSSDDKSWLDNSRGYDFGIHEFLGIRISGYKTPDRHLSFIIAGPMYASVALSFPLPDEVVEKSRNHADPKRRNIIRVLYQWKEGRGEMYVNAVEVASFNIQPVIFDTLDFAIYGSKYISYRTTATIIVGIGDILNRLYSFQRYRRIEEIDQSIEFGMNDQLFTIIHGESGSFKGTIKGVSSVITFFKENYIKILSIINGHSTRLAEAYTSKKEAESAIMFEHLEQEKIKTLAQSLALSRETVSAMREFGIYKTDLETEQIINQYLAPVINRIGGELLNRRLTLEIKIPEERPKEE